MWIAKTRRFFHVCHVMKIAMRKSIRNLELMNRPVEGNRLTAKVGKRRMVVCLMTGEKVS